MLKKVCFVSLFAFVFFFLSDISMAQNIKEGLWEITVKMEMEEGMPVKMPDQTIKQCIKKEDPVPKIEEPDKTCKFMAKQIKGDTVSWKAECRDEEGVFTVTGKITYRGNSFDGTEEYRENGALIMKGRISGEWIGQCK